MQMWRRWMRGLVLLAVTAVLVGCAGGAGNTEPSGGVPGPTPTLPTAAPARPSEPGATVEAPDQVVQRFVQALDADDRDTLLALVATDMASPIQRVADLRAAWKRRSEPALAFGTDQLGLRQGLEVGPAKVRGQTATADVVARHEAGTLVLTLLLRSDGAAWRVADWNSETRDLALPTPTPPGLR